MSVATEWLDPVLSSTDAETVARWRKAQEAAKAEWNRAESGRQLAAALSAGRLPSGIHGLRCKFGDVLIPLHDLNGGLWAVVYINSQCHPDDENPLNQRPRKGSHFQRTLGVHFWHGAPIEGDGTGKIIGLIEHLHDAPLWGDASGAPCAVAFTPENIRPLANALRSRYPGACLVLWAMRKAEEPTMYEVAKDVGAQIVYGWHGPDMVQALQQSEAATGIAGGDA